MKDPAELRGTVVWYRPEEEDLNQGGETPSNQKAAHKRHEVTSTNQKLGDNTFPLPDETKEISKKENPTHESRTLRSPPLPSRLHLDNIHGYPPYQASPRPPQRSMVDNRKSLNDHRLIVGIKC